MIIIIIILIIYHVVRLSRFLSSFIFSCISSTTSSFSYTQRWYHRFSRAEWEDCIVPFNCYSELRKILTHHFIGWQFTTKCCVMQHKAFFLITKMFRNANDNGGERNQWTKNKKEITFFETTLRVETYYATNGNNRLWSDS